MSKQNDALKLALEALEGLIKKTSGQSIYSFMETERRIAMSACVGIKEVLAQPEQEPVAWGIIASNTGRICQVELDADEVEGHNPKHIVPLYPTPPQRNPLTDWIDPNDKAQERFLPNIGEPVIFCCRGETYIGTHTGGGFQDAFDEENYFNTWSCRWMPIPIPAAHGIKE